MRRPRRWLSRRWTALGVLGLLLLAALVVACRAQLSWERVLAKVRGDFPRVEQLSTAELAAWLADDSRPAPLLLDVREADEYAVSHLPGALRVSPSAATVELPEDFVPGHPIVAYCSVGYRSSRWLERLRASGDEDLGASRIYNLEGSIFRWANEGRPLERDGEAVSGVHPYNPLWGKLLDRERRQYDSGTTDSTVPDGSRP